MNPYTQNLNRLEFVITYACTGRCKHCSEGEHLTSGEHIDAEVAVQAIRSLTSAYSLKSLMTFGGEPLLHPEVVCEIHRVATEVGIPKRQLITNGYFSKNPDRIREVAKALSECGVNDVLLSVDAFHQETIPLEPVKAFAQALLDQNVPLRMQPAWLVSETADNPYNRRTKELLSEFAAMGIRIHEGNVIFASGNALKYLAEYFDADTKSESPYEEDPRDVRAIGIDPDGTVLGGNVYRQDILEIVEGYAPVD